MRATKEQRRIINAKKEVFDGYHIPWDESIERKFIARLLIFKFEFWFLYSFLLT